jgi:hypothetical protein
MNRANGIHCKSTLTGGLGFSGESPKLRLIFVTERRWIIGGANER